MSEAVKETEMPDERSTWEAARRIESFAGYLPRALSPQGELSISLGVVPGGELNGELTITGAATRPILPLAPIRDIQARVLFAGRRATIHPFTARIGGREVTMTGQFEWLAEQAERMYAVFKPLISKIA